MSLAAAFTLLVLGATLFALAREHSSPDTVLLGALSLFTLTGIVDVETALSGFANPAVVAIGSLFVVAAGLRHAGVLDRAARWLFGGVESLRGALGRLTSTTAVASAFLNNTPIVAMAVPAVRSWAADHDVSPAKLLMPLSFASILGGLCTLIGTSTNLVADGLLKQHGLAGLGFFELARVGVPLALVGLAYLVLVAPRLLAVREAAREVQADEEAGEVVMAVAEGSPLVGERAGAVPLPDSTDLYHVRTDRPGRPTEPLRDDEAVEAGDRLVFSGDGASLDHWQGALGLEPIGPVDRLEAPAERCEIVLRENSPLAGQTVAEIDMPARYGAKVLGVFRGGEHVDRPTGEIELHAGDALFLLVPRGFVREHEDATAFYLVRREEVGDGEREEGELERRPEHAPTALALLAAIVGLVTLGVVPMAVAAMAGAVGMVTLGVLEPGDARDAVDWSVLLVIGAALGIAQALQASGAADVVAEGIVGAGAALGPVGVLGATFVGCMLFTTLVTNNAAVALMFPVALAAATAEGLAVRPFVVAVTIAASLSLATPLGYQTNLMVYGPGGYRFSDFVRVGLPLQLLLAAVASLVIPMVWPLTP